MVGSIARLVISNQAALAAKYGPAGHAAVTAALGRLVAADRGAGLTTRVLAIDDAADMLSVGGKAVAGPADERGAKMAVDAAFAALKPDYIMLLDGPDVVPHIALAPIAGLDDGDATIPSDLPYASNAGWSRTASRFQSVTRVVSRLPAAAGATDAGGIVALIDRAIAHAPRPSSAFSPPFVLSASAWQASTRTSAAAVFGPGTAVDLAPPSAHAAIDAALPRLAHFINCHGAQVDDAFYGDDGTSTPIAMRSGSVAPHVVPGTVIAAECCYGAELFDHLTLGIGRPMCMAYMAGGAAAYLGSTTIAYGPAATNGQADLLTQDFLRHVLSGASIGRALLQARQDFVRTQAMASPANLKTLAQFILLGDPACRPSLGEPDEPEDAGLPQPDSGAGDPAMLRKARRVALAGEGQALAEAATRTAGPADLPPALASRLRAIAVARGIAPDAMTVLEVSGGANYRAAAKLLDGDRKVAVIVDRTRRRDRPGPSVRILTAHILEDRILRVEQAESRSWRSGRCTSRDA